MIQRWIPVLLVPVVVGACGGGEPPHAGDADASSVLAGARRSVGWTEARLGPRHGVALEANVEWDGPAYQVELVSANDGSVLLRFVDGAAFSAGPSGGWARLTPESVTPLTDTLETFVRGHDLLLTLLRPETRLADLELGAAATFYGADALLVTGVDALGETVSLYYSLADTVPLGYVVEDHLRGGGPVTTTFHDWSSGDAVRFPGRVRFAQGGEVFDYEVTSARVLAAIPDSAFEPPRHDVPGRSDETDL